MGTGGYFSDFPFPVPDPRSEHPTPLTEPALPHNSGWIFYPYPATWVPEPPQTPHQPDNINNPFTKSATRPLPTGNPKNQQDQE